MNKDWYIEAHEREVADYMDRHPNATWEQAYNRTADRAENIFACLGTRFAEMASQRRAA